MPYESEIERIRYLYVDERLSLQRVASEVGISIPTLTKWMDRASIPRRAAKIPDRYDELIGEIRRMYVDEGMSGEDIAQELESSPPRIYEYLKRAGIEVGAPRKDTRQKLSTASSRQPKAYKACENPACGKQYEVKPSKAEERHYCSAQCRWQHQQVRDRVCPCGKPARSKNSRYCSDACRVEYGGPTGPVRDPANWVVFNCEACGVEVERRKNENWNYRFCSNKCAKSRGWFNGRKLQFDSMLEVCFVAECHRSGLRWRYYDGPDIETSVGIYRPDFIVMSSSGEETVVECKRSGWLAPEETTKISEAAQKIPSFRVITEDDLAGEFQATG